MKINNRRSFGYNLDHGATKEELRKYYSLSPGQYEKIVSSLAEIRERAGVRK